MEFWSRPRLLRYGRERVGHTAKGEVDSKTPSAFVAADLLRTTIHDYATFLVGIMHDDGLTKQVAAQRLVLTRDQVTPEQKAKLGKLSPDAVKESDLAGEPITAKLTKAPGNDAPIGGLKVVAESGWFAARPSGTENIYKIYAESFRNEAHLQAIVSEAQQIVNNALAGPAKA